MPGNEVTDKVHNFFEQDNLSQGHQSQVGGGNWPDLNNSLWAGTQRLNGTPLNSNPKSYSVDTERGNGRQSSQMPFDRNHTQLTLRSEFAKSHNSSQQLNLNGFMHISPGLQTRVNEPEYLGEDTVPDRHNLTSKGLATFESQKRNPPEFSSGLVRNSEKLELAEAPVNFGFLGRQSPLMQGQHPGMSQPQPRQQSGFNEMQLWQQQLMYKQLQDLQRQRQLQQLDQEPRQQSSVNQLSGITKQAAVDQLHSMVNGMPFHDACNYTLQNELMGGDSKIPSSSQMFMVGNMNWAQRRGTAATCGFPNGLMISHDQVQALQSMGIVPQQLDQSLYGTPVSINRTPLNQYSQFQGVSHECADVMTKSGGNQVEKPLMQSGAFNYFQSDQCVFPEQGCLQDGLAAKQSFPGKTLFGHVPVQNVSSGDMSENFHQLNPIGRSMQVQEFQGRQERADWPGNSQEKTLQQVGPSQGLVNLDPTEQKLLFSTDDDGHWDASFGRSGNSHSGVHLHGNIQEGNDYFNAFPSVQSGSWSALMQSAVAETCSSDTGLHDEWNGVSFQKTELSSGNHLTVFGDSGKQKIDWVDNNVQSASSLTSRPFPLFEDANASANDDNAPMFQQSSVKSAYDQSERVHGEASHESLQQSSKDVGNQLDQNQLEKNFLEGNLQVQMHLENSPGGGWAEQLYEHPISTVHSAEVELNLQSVQGTWTHQQNMPSYNIGNQTYCKLNGWNNNESLSSGGDATFKIRDNERTVQHTLNDPKGTIHIESDQNGNTWKSDGNRVSVPLPHQTGGFGSVKSGVGSPKVRTEEYYMSNSDAVINSNNSISNQDKNQQVLNRNKGHYGKHAAVNSSVKSNGNENVGKHQHQPNKGPQVWESSVNNSDKVLGETYLRKQENSFQKEVSNESYISKHSHSGQPTDSGGGARENFSLAGSDTRPSVSGNQKPSGQIGQKNYGPRRFQYHPMGNLGVNVEPTETPNYTSYLQGQPQMATHGLKSQETGFLGHSQFVGHIVSNNEMDMDQRHSLVLQGNAKGTEEIHSRSTISGHDSNLCAAFDKSAAFFAQNKRPGQTSQNMLELLHKVDQSRDSSTISHLGFSDHNTSERPEAATSDRPAAQLQHNQSSALQGLGLHLAQPSQRRSVPNHALASHTSSQTVNDYNSRQFDLEVGEKNQTWSNSTVAVRPLPPMHEVSQRENWDNKSSLSGQSSKEILHSNMQATSSAMAASSQPYARNQQQCISSASGHVVTHQTVNMSFGSQLEMDEHSKNPSRFRQHDSHSGVTHNGAGAVADQSRQTSLHGAPSRIPPFRVASPSDIRVPVGSQSYSIDTGQSQVMSTSSSHPRNSGQQFPGSETQPVSQPSTASGTSQQGGFSAILNNVWTSVSARQHSSGNLSNKPTPNLFQSISQSSLGTTSWAPQKPDDQENKKGGSAPSGFGACSINSQQFTYGEEQAGEDCSLQQRLREKMDLAAPTASSPQVNEPVAKHTSDGNSSVSIPSLVRLHQQDLGRSKHGQGSSLDQQTDHASLLNIAASNCDFGALGHSFKSSDVQHQNYTLLQHMQAMKTIETDPSKRLGKRLNGADSGAVAQQMVGKASQKFLYGYNTVVRVPENNELSATAYHSSFPSDAKMLCFSSEANENQNAMRASQFIGREVPSQDLASSSLCDPQNHSHCLSITSGSPSVGGTEHVQINPQMAPSWFEQYETFKNGQVLSMHSGVGGPQNTAKAATQHYFFSKTSESMDAPSTIEQRNDASQVGCVWRGTSTTTATNDQSSSFHRMPSDVINRNLVPRPKKRKSATSELLPWHKEITQGSRKLRSISIAELDWAQAANRLIEKVEDEAEMSEDVPSMPRARRRLILTTQLMQQLFPAVPAIILSADATSEYDSVTYLVTKLTLGDACSLSRSESDSRVLSDSGNTISEKLKTSEMVGDQFFSKVVEGFIGRGRKLENDLSRLERRASILDVRVECQDLERFSIINRFAKFHGRSHTEGVESSSTSETGRRQIFPQRYVTALPIPGNLPEGVLCLSL